MSEQNPQTQEPVEKDHNIKSRLLVAAAFATVGGKLGTVGTIIDANETLKGQNLTLGGKIKSVFNGKLFHELNKQTVGIMKTEGKSMMSAISKTMKWGIVTTVAGMAAGAVIGWQRGGKIDNWKDIIKNPWDSTKIIFGAKEPEKKNASEPEKTSVAAEEKSTYWQDKVKDNAKSQEAAIAH